MEMQDNFCYFYFFFVTASKKARYFSLAEKKGAIVKKGKQRLIDFSGGGECKQR